jgi:hypothetical protein
MEFEQILGQVGGPLSVELWKLDEADRHRWEALAARTGWAEVEWFDIPGAFAWRRPLPGEWEVTWQQTYDSGNLLDVRIMPPEHPLAWQRHLVDLLRELGQALEREVVLVDEGAGVPLLRFEPATGQVSVAPPPRPVAADRPTYPLCCAALDRQFSEPCTTCADPFYCPDTLIVYDAKADSYALPIRDGGTSRTEIGFCPWCGAALPPAH